jgi:hypothetical protein
MTTTISNTDHVVIVAQLIGSTAKNSKKAKKLSFYLLFVSLERGYSALSYDAKSK